MLTWGAVVAIGMIGLYRYQAAPSVAAQQIPDRWPLNSGMVRDSNRPVLLMMLHPRCPCSRASIHELSEVLSRAGGEIDARVVFVEPQGAPPDWSGGELWKLANKIPGVKVVIDHQGIAATAFGATNSGQVLVYDVHGNLVFNGGITDGRGHEGDNPGMLSVIEIIRNKKPQTQTTPVYGCSLGVCKMPENAIGTP